MFLIRKFTLLLVLIVFSITIKGQEVTIQTQFTQSSCDKVIKVTGYLMNNNSIANFDSELMTWELYQNKELLYKQNLELEKSAVEFSGLKSNQEYILQLKQGEEIVTESSFNTNDVYPYQSLGLSYRAIKNQGETFALIITPRGGIKSNYHFQLEELETENAFPLIQSETGWEVRDLEKGKSYQIILKDGCTVLEIPYKS